MSKYEHLTQTWVEEYNKGMSFRQIGERHGVSKVTVKRNIEPYITQRPRSATEKFVPKWIELYEKGWSQTDIGRKYQVSDTTVIRKLKEAGVYVKTMNTRPAKYEKFIDEWIELYKDKGYSLKEIANKYGCSIPTVHNIIKQKIEMRSYSESSRKYTINDTYFSSIDSKEKAYWLGYLFASGSLIKQINAYAMLIACAKKDDNQITRFLQAISSDSPISVRTDNMASARVFSETMYRDLERWGLVLNKLYLLRMPSLDSTEYARSFILGYFDGKAVLSKSRPLVTISGPKEFLEDLNSFIKNELGFSLTIVANYQKEYDYDRYQLSSYSKHKTIALLRWLYHNQPNSLRRHLDSYRYYEEAFTYDKTIMEQLVSLKGKS